MKSSTSVALWRSLVVILAVCAATQFAIEVISAPRGLTLGVRGEPLFTGGYVQERGPTTFVVDTLSPASPLVAAGVVPGDRLRYDTPLGRWYNVVAGDKVSLTVMHGDTTRRLEVTVAAAGSLPRYLMVNYILGALSVLLALVIGVVIGWRRTDLSALRALAVTALLAPLAFPYSAPEAIHLSWLDFMGSVSTVTFVGVIVFFALNYPDDRPTGWRAILKRGYPWFFGLHTIAALVFFGRLYAGYFEPVCWPLFRVAEALEPALFFGAILLAWRTARGESRVRFQWILATLGAMVGVFLLGNLNAWTGKPIPVEEFELLSNVTLIVAEIGFVYAIFRHQVFDFGFAINRALVYGIASAILLLAFFLLEKLAEHYLHVEGRGQNALLDGGIALGVFLFFHRVRHWVEHHLERLFFSKWHNNEKALRHFVKQAAHITRGDALMAALTVELDRFTGATGNATYRRTADGHFQRVAGTLDGVPEIVDANEAMVVALRTDRHPVRCDETLSKLPAVIALPMSHRAELDGFVLVGNKRSREIYRPDEIELLGFAATQVGLDVYALEAAAFESEAALLRASNQEMRRLVELALAGQNKSD